MHSAGSGTSSRKSSGTGRLRGTSCRSSHCQKFVLGSGRVPSRMPRGWQRGDECASSARQGASDRSVGRSP
jgi:hypothetical protein